MGEFVTASAFRTQNTDAVQDTALGFFAAQSWAAEPIESTEPATDDDVLIYPPANGWTVILWPAFFTEIAAVEFMSRQLGTLTSTVRIHDGDYWSHALLHDGMTLDRFASVPDYFTDEPDEIARLRIKYAGRPAVVAEAVNCPAQQVAPYFVHLDLEDSESKSGRAFPDDEFELDDPWVFVDFWKRLGPSYPQDPSTYLAQIRLAAGWLGKLTTGDAEL